MHFDEFHSKLEKCKGIDPCILMNFDSKLEKCKGVSPCILMNLNQNSKNVKVLLNAF